MLRPMLTLALLAACSAGPGEDDITPPIQQCKDDGREPGALDWHHQEGLVDVVDLATSPAGDIARVGRGNNLEVFDRDGRLRWSDTYHGAGIETGTAPLDVAVDGAGHVHVLVFETILHVNGGNEFSDIGPTIDARLVVLRYAPDGTREWRWVRERPPVEPFEQYIPRGGIGVVDGSILVLEMALDEPTVVIELDRSGLVVAETELAVPDVTGYEGWRNDFGPDGDVYLGGRSSGGGWVGRFAPDGSLAWHHEFTDDPDVSLSEMVAVVAGAEDDVHVAWNNYDGPTIRSLVHRLGADGELVWTDMLPGVRVQDGARVLAEGCETSVVFTGDLMGPFVFTLWVGAYSAEGARTWSYLRESDEGASGQQIAGAHDGDVIVSGRAGGYPWLGRLAVR